METFTDQDLLNELLTLDPAPIERHGGITCQEYAEARKVNYRLANERLNKMARDGKLYREWTLVPGKRPVWVYYKVVG